MTAKRIGLVLAIALAAVASTSLVNAQQQPPPLSVKPLNGGVYWTQGGAGGNTGIIVGKDGVIVIDAKTTPASAKEMLAEVAKITPKPSDHRHRDAQRRRSRKRVGRLSRRLDHYFPGKLQERDGGFRQFAESRATRQAAHQNRGE